MKTQKKYMIELRNHMALSGLYLTPENGLKKDFPIMEAKYFFDTREDAEAAGMEEASTWYDPWRVVFLIHEIEIEIET